MTDPGSACARARARSKNSTNPRNAVATRAAQAPSCELAAIKAYAAKLALDAPPFSPAQQRELRLLLGAGA